MCRVLTNFYSNYIAIFFCFQGVLRELQRNERLNRFYSQLFLVLGYLQFFLLGTIFNQIVQRLDKYLFMYQEIDRLYILSKN